VSRFAPLVALLTAGCGSPAPADRATVSGTVTLAGRPVTGGSIRLVALDDPARQVHGRILRGGTFTLTGARVGRVRVAVETVSAQEGADSPDRGAFVRVPARYARPDTSPLTLDIPAGGAVGLAVAMES
jgi:hypothetical protein